MKNQVKYYGIRGSIPVPGREYEIYGGNTTSVLIKDKNTYIIIDAGTGIRNIGTDLIHNSIAKKGLKINILFTHSHWDHIQGFPFFIPAYFPDIEFHIYGVTKMIPRVGTSKIQHKDRWNIKKTLNFQQCYQYFPVRMDQMSAEFYYHEIIPDTSFRIDHIQIDTLALNHPNDSIGFRFHLTGGDFTFCTDTEPKENSSSHIIEFAEGSDIFAYDSQYTPEEYENGKIGWGHSTYIEGSRIAKAAKVKNYHLIHHDPVHNDKFLDSLQEKSIKEFKNSLVIKEGMDFTF